MAAAMLNQISCHRRADDADMRRAQKKGDMFRWSIGAVRSEPQDENFNVDAGGIIDAATDAANLWLVRAETKTVETDDLARGTARSQKADVSLLHCGRDTTISGPEPSGKTGTPISPARWWVASGQPDYREVDGRLDRPQESEGWDFAHIDIHTWPERSKERRRAAQLPMSVTDIIRRPGRQRRIVVGQPKDLAKVDARL